MTGDIFAYLLQKRYATENQIAGAQASHLPLREALQANGVLVEHLYEAWARELQMPFVDLHKFEPERSAVALLPAHIAKKHNAIPLRQDKQTIYVAFSDPNDIAAQDAVRLATRYQFRVVLATPDAIRQTIHAYYEA